MKGVASVARFGVKAMADASARRAAATVAIACCLVMVTYVLKLYAYKVYAYNLDALINFPFQRILSGGFSSVRVSKRSVGGS